jgi:hypothetical protein
MKEQKPFKESKLRTFYTNLNDVLHYACETWRVLKTSMNKLQSFVSRCL